MKTIKNIHDWIMFHQPTEFETVYLRREFSIGLRRLSAHVASRFLVLLTIGLVLASSEVCAGMFGFGKKYDVELFPVVEGRVVRDGVPLEGVTIVREATYDSAEIQKTTTNSDGYFAFPDWVIRSATPGKPLAEVRLRQVIVARYEGSTFLLWYYVTGRISGEKVIAEKLHSLNCDLGDDEIDYHFPKAENADFTHNISSICRWD